MYSGIRKGSHDFSTSEYLRCTIGIKSATYGETAFAIVYKRFV